ncbi:MAG: alpha/beta fold hydrolase [Acidimicrobiales bacterium]
MSQPRAHRVSSSDGVHVVAYDYGGDGRPVIFAHATGFHGRYWDPICSKLGPAFRCITVDLRGHGDSEVPVGLDMRWTGMANDITAVIDAFELPSILAVGHSMGGCSIVLAEQARPGLIERAWVFEPIIMPPELTDQVPVESSVMVQAALRRRETFDSRVQAYERYRSRPPFSTVDPAALSAYVDHGFDDLDDGSVILKCRRETEAAVFSNSRTDAFANLGSVETPTVVGGSGDGGHPAGLAPVVAERLVNGTFEYQSDLSHFAPMESPDRISVAISNAFDVS